MSAVDEYKEQREAAARSLLELQGPDRGWGRRPDSESSLVNTAEVLNVIRAAGLDGTEKAQAAARFIVRALPVHYRPRGEDVTQPARGENLRYLSFGLDGLVTIPEVAFTEDGIGAIRFCVERIAAVQKNGAVPPKPGSEVMSYHATARALIAVAKLIATPGSDAVPAELLDSARRIAGSAAGYLIREQDDESAAWTVDPTAGSPLSLSKTAIANTALGYYRLLNDRSDYRDHQKAASAWLLDNYSKWVHDTSSDNLEASTDWSHLDYAECVRGLAAGRDGSWTVLQRSWNYMIRLWSKRDSLWTEPKGNATIPAAYHTVMAFESVLPRTRVIVPPPIGAEPFGLLQSVRVDPGSGIVLSGSEGTVVVTLSIKLDEMVGALAAHPEGMTAKELAAAIGQKPNVISGYTGRLNDAVRERSGGAIGSFVEAVPGVGRERTYRLSTRQDGV